MGLIMVFCEYYMPYMCVVSFMCVRNVVYKYQSTLRKKATVPLLFHWTVAIIIFTAAATLIH